LQVLAGLSLEVFAVALLRALGRPVPALAADVAAGRVEPAVRGAGEGAGALAQGAAGHPGEIGAITLLVAAELAITAIGIAGGLLDLDEEGAAGEDPEDGK